MENQQFHELTDEERSRLEKPVQVVIHTENISFAANDVHLPECKELVIKASEIADIMEDRIRKSKRFNINSESNLLEAVLPE